MKKYYHVSELNEADARDLNLAPFIVMVDFPIKPDLERGAIISRHKSQKLADEAARRFGYHGFVSARWVYNYKY